ncbi:JAB domain-containing protein [uncultured Parabacteroides sp.]|uniref:JAB domain-containing protein n=1 Tax=uncultured Parabacteroides sp. TaxID=512312 RepID=UPI00260F9772|nr:JAB domain-containing protein [uncultured Parabacteroides sp.]
MVKKAVEYKLSANKCEFEQKKIMSSSDVYDYAKQFYFDDLLIYESSFIILTNRANSVLGYAKISQGGVAGAFVDVKIVAKYAIESLCEGVFFIHNHPSGNVKPSIEDRKITDKLKKALSLFAMKVYYSFDNEIKYISIYLFFK